MEHPNNQGKSQDAVSLQDLFAALSVLLKLWWKKKVIVMGAALLGAVMGFAYANFFRSETYTSRITFSLQQKNQQLNPAQLLLGSTVGGGELFSGENLGVLLKSNRVLEQTLLKPGITNTDSSLLNCWMANNMHAELESGQVKPFIPGRNRETFNRQEDSLINGVVKAIKDNIEIQSIGGGIMELVVTGEDEQWAWEFSQVLLNAATDLYFELKVGKTKRNLAVLENRLDSVQRALNSSMYSAAAEADQSLGIYQSQSRIPLAKKEIQSQLLRTMYTELFRTIEVTKSEINRDEPVFELIDKPRLPLDKTGKGRLKFAALLGIGLGLISMIVLSIVELTKRVTREKTENHTFNDKHETA